MKTTWCSIICIARLWSGLMDHGVSGDPSLTRAALARPFRSAFGEEMYSTVYLKAAALLDAIVNNVVFKDGNKRTALAAASLYLALNDRVLEFRPQESEWFMYQVVVARPQIDDIAKWLRQHTRKQRLTAEQ